MLPGEDLAAAIRRMTAAHARNLQAIHDEHRAFVASLEQSQTFSSVAAATVPNRFSNLSSAPLPATQGAAPQISDGHQWYSEEARHSDEGMKAQVQEITDLKRRFGIVTARQQQQKEDSFWLRQMREDFTLRLRTLGIYLQAVRNELKAVTHQTDLASQQTAVLTIVQDILGKVNPLVNERIQQHQRFLRYYEEDFGITTWVSAGRRTIWRFFHFNTRQRFDKFRLDIIEKAIQLRQTVRAWTAPLSNGDFGVELGNLDAWQLDIQAHFVEIDEVNSQTRDRLLEANRQRQWYPPPQAVLMPADTNQLSEAEINAFPWVLAVNIPQVPIRVPGQQQTTMLRVDWFQSQFIPDNRRLTEVPFEQIPNVDDDGNDNQN